MSARTPAQDRDPLAANWAAAFQRPTPPRLSTQLLQISLAYRLQTIDTGGVARRVREALQQAAKHNATPTARRPRVGSQLLREWNGVTHVVEVVDGGYRYRDRLYTSLTAIAFEITGARWSGPRFFGLKKRSR
jgi:hypothetical protein